MFCNKCGQPIAVGIEFCPSCGANVAGQAVAAPAADRPAAQPGVERSDFEQSVADQSAAQAPAPIAPAAPGSGQGAPVYAPPAAPVSPTGSQYASFGARFAAVLIDGIIGWIVSAMIQIPLGLGIGFSNFGNDPNPAAIVGMVAVSMIAGISFSWLYEALLLSSAWQATLGKKALGIIVIDEQGRRISFLRATGRHFSKIVSGLVLMAGYLIQPFTPKRQALHDIMAGTLVVKP